MATQYHIHLMTKEYCLKVYVKLEIIIYLTLLLWSLQ
jgi:hypothetical protein